MIIEFYYLKMRSIMRSPRSFIKSYTFFFVKEDTKKTYYNVKINIKFKII